MTLALLRLAATKTPLRARVLFIHGMDSSAATWSGVLDRLRAAGDVDACIVRPGMVTWHAGTGRGAASDICGRFFAGCLALGAGIDEEDYVLVDVFPVDQLVQAMRAHNAQGTRETRALTGRHHLTYAAAGRALGVPLLPYPQWRERLVRAGRANALFPLLSSFPRGRPAPPNRTSLGRDSQPVDTASLARFIAANRSGWECQGR